MSRSRPRNARGCSSAASSTRRRNGRPGAESRPMGATAASLVLLADTVSAIQNFVYVFVWIYSILIFAYVLTGWIRLPYSPWLNRIQRLLYEVLARILDQFH